MPAIMDRTWRFVENIEALTISREEVHLHDLSKASRTKSCLFGLLTAAYRRGSGLQTFLTSPREIFHRRDLAHRLHHHLDAVVEQRFHGKKQAAGKGSEKKCAPSRTGLPLSLE
ncbi:uncharacterized protein BDW47DRAFT_128296 [Aspergillus candidus]|uniref:Uncharacterized protein n=1 Tax=Aspergillus candidus TaxID=41067 RepID=A0A2I2F3L4_ASPCN|nr:hypothetical protein BDW47DRAFT_128296 [Aspergillus candidus]PLB35227.1 hypothetical protein BDW47DRAFT_128296 [Aspergillus candidus]